MTTRRAWACLVLGLALTAAPLAFQMFTRAPGGAQMLTSFEPFMHEDVLTGFRDQLAVTGSAVTEAESTVPAVLAAELGAAPSLPALDRLASEWPTIRDDMVAMLDDITANIDNYDAVVALPPFGLFPWFFVIPGLLTAAIGGVALAATRRGRPAPGPRGALVALAVGLVAAPFAFQMFTRAPLGGEMIDDFRPMMTATNITTVQGYFLTMAGGEAALRNDVVGSLAGAGMDGDEIGDALPATTQFVTVWPQMSADMAPMLGAMADNLGNFAGIAALPPFPLFPWFFVIPGLLLLTVLLTPGRRHTTVIDLTDNDRADTPADTLMS